MHLFTPILFALGFCHEFAIECGCLRCYAQRVGKKRWKLEFNVYVTRHHGESTMETKVRRFRTPPRAVEGGRFSGGVRGALDVSVVGLHASPMSVTESNSAKNGADRGCQRMPLCGPEPGEWQRYLEVGRRPSLG